MSTAELAGTVTSFAIFLCVRTEKTFFHAAKLMDSHPKLMDSYQNEWIPTQNLRIPTQI